MSFINEGFWQSFKGYSKTPPSIKELALTKTAIQLCENVQLKIHILCTPKPVFADICSSIIWDKLIFDQSSVLCDILRLPAELKPLLILRIRLIAIRVLAWYKEFEIKHRISDQFLVPSDWTSEGRIDERRVAERLMRVEEIPVFRRYQIACQTFSEPYIKDLWLRVPDEHRVEFFYVSLCSPDRIRRSMLVMLWSYYLAGRLEEFFSIDVVSKFGHDDFWKRGFEEAISEGQREAVIYCWKMLSESTKQQVIINSALQTASLYHKVTTEVMRFSSLDGKYDNITIQVWESKIWQSKKWCPMPAHYGDIFLFLFLQMSEEQRIAFFEKIFERFTVLFGNVHLFLFFLQPPYDGYFMPMIDKLWRFTHAEYYASLLLNLANKYKKEMEYPDYDYGRLLKELLIGVPERYKYYLFHETRRVSHKLINIASALICNILEKQTFECRSFEIIQNVSQLATPREKLSIIDYCGEKLCEYFIERKNWVVLDMVLADCLPGGERADLKKNFLASNMGTELCFRILLTENEEIIDSLMNWSDLLEQGISQFKSKINCAWYPENSKTKLLVNMKLNHLDEVLEYCLPSEDTRKQFKDEFLEVSARYICYTIIRSSQCEKITQFMIWALGSEEAANAIKCDYFDEKFCTWILRDLVISQRWANRDFFEKWCGLSAEALQQIKLYILQNTKETILELLLHKETDTVSLFLYWGFSNAENVNEFKTCFRAYILESEKAVLNIRCREQILETWNMLVADRLRDIENPKQVERHEMNTKQDLVFTSRQNYCITYNGIQR